MSLAGLSGALAVGVAFGYAAQRGAFCMNSGLRGPLEGDWTKLKALGLAIGLQLVALPAAFALGWARPVELPLKAVAAVSGGMLFGASMRWAGGCAAGVWYKLGAGDLGAMLAVLGMAIGATATESGPLAGLRLWLQGSGNSARWTSPPLFSVLAGVVLIAMLARSADSRAGAWSWRTTGLWIGVVATVAWPVSFAADRSFGLAVLPGTTGLLSATAGLAFPAWDAVLVVGILIGGFFAARHTGGLTLTAPKAAILLKRFVGGLGLGIGASVATGCTVGQGLTGLALLAPASFVVMAAIFAGSTIAALVARRPAARPLTPAAASR